MPWARSALFATALSTNFEDGDVRETVYNVGLQVDFRMHVMHRLPMMLSFGYAGGFEAIGRDDDEFMISLQGPLMGGPAQPATPPMILESRPVRRWGSCPWSPSWRR